VVVANLQVLFFLRQASCFVRQTNNKRYGQWLLGVSSGVRLLMEQTNDFVQWSPTNKQNTSDSGLPSGTWCHTKKTQDNKNTRKTCMNQVE
jgi:hypothetical protein